MLFESTKPVNIPLKDGSIFYDPCFFDNKEADHYFEVLRNDIKWQQDNIKIFGKTYAQPKRQKQGKLLKSDLQHRL